MGEGVQRNDQRARELDLQAAALGVAPAQARLGYDATFPQDPAARDPASALPWLNAAAEQEHGPALYILGQLYLFGQAVEADPEFAWRLMTRAGGARSSAGASCSGWASARRQPPERRRAAGSLLLANGRVVEKRYRRVCAWQAISRRATSREGPRPRCTMVDGRERPRIPTGASVARGALREGSRRRGRREPRRRAARPSVADNARRCAERVRLGARREPRLRAAQRRVRRRDNGGRHGRAADAGVSRHARCRVCRGGPVRRSGGFAAARHRCIAERRPRCDPRELRQAYRAVSTRANRIARRHDSSARSALRSCVACGGRAADRSDAARGLAGGKRAARDRWRGSSSRTSRASSRGTTPRSPRNRTAFGPRSRAAILSSRFRSNTRARSSATRFTSAASNASRISSQRFPDHPDVRLWQLQRTYGDEERLTAGQDLLNLVDRARLDAPVNARASIRSSPTCRSASTPSDVLRARTADYARRALEEDIRADVRLILGAYFQETGDPSGGARSIDVAVRRPRSAGQLVPRAQDGLPRRAQSARGRPRCCTRQLDGSSAYYDRTETAAALRADRRARARASGSSRTRLPFTGPYDDRQRFLLALEAGSADEAQAAYDSWRDAGFWEDPIGINRFALFLAHPALPWRARDALGLLGALAFLAASLLAWGVPLAVDPLSRPRQPPACGNAVVERRVAPTRCVARLGGVLFGRFPQRSTRLGRSMRSPIPSRRGPSPRNSHNSPICSSSSRGLVSRSWPSSLTCCGVTWRGGGRPIGRLASASSSAWPGPWYFVCRCS